MKLQCPSLDYVKLSGKEETLDCKSYRPPKFKKQVLVDNKLWRLTLNLEVALKKGQFCLSYLGVKSKTVTSRFHSTGGA